MHIEAADTLGDPCDLQPNAFDRVHRLQPLRADFGAIHDDAATEQPVGIVVRVVKPLLGCTVMAVEDEAVRLDQAGWPDELVGVPPLRRTLAAAAGAQDALVRTVEPVAFGQRLQAFSFRRLFGIDEARGNSAPMSDPQDSTYRSELGVQTTWTTSL
jgi:hypothetical protein